MKCRACDHSLVKTKIDGTVVLACTDCHGVWFFGMKPLYAFLDVPGVAWFDHIGGFVFGFFAVAAMRKLDML